MKTLFLFLELLTDGDALRNILHSCFTAALVCVGTLLLLGTYQVLRPSCLRRNAATPSRS
jgi:hypothetical protein